jgi:hypothetical protein
MSIIDTTRGIIGKALGGRTLPKRPGRSKHITPPYPGFNWEDCLIALQRDPQMSDEDFAAIMGRDVSSNTLPAANSQLVQSYRQAAARELRRRELTMPVPSPQNATTAPLARDTTINGESTTVWESTGNNTATMSLEELTARRLARVENARMGRSAHDKFMLGVKAAWRVIAPPWFVAVTAGEVVTYLSHYMPHADLPTDVLIWGVALFLELSMMVATYDLSERNRVEAEKHAAGVAIGKAERKKKRLAIVFWFLLAATNITGQVAFLWFVTHPDGVQVDPGTQTFLIVFIVVRVVGMLIGDANTAFVLGDDEKELTQVARDEKQRGEAFTLIAEAEGEYRKNVAEANHKVAQIDSQVERLKMEMENQKRRDNYHAELDRIMMEESLDRQQQRQRQLPPPRPNDDDDDPQTMP